MRKILLPLLVLSIVGCSSSDEATMIDGPNPDNELPLESFGSVELPTNGFDSIPGSELVGDLSYDPFVEQDGISIHITSFGFTGEGDPRVTARLDNQGRSAVEFATCAVEALQSGVFVSGGILSFAGLGFVDPGKSGVGIISFFDELPDGFNSFNELQFDCAWNSDENTRIDIQTGTQQVEFLGYSISDRGYTSVSLRRTNNSEGSVPILFCTVEALIGTVILDVANVGFPPIDAGEVFEASGLFLSFNSLQGFNDDSFEYSLLYCENRN